MHITSVEHGLLRLLRDRRRAPADRLRAGLGRHDPPHRAGHRVLLRRRDDQRRRRAQKQSTWPRCGGCRSCSCARTTGTWSTPRSRSVIQVALPAADRACRLRAGPDRGGRQRRVRGPAGGRRRGPMRPGTVPGPSLIEAQTYRLKGHSAADGAAYRPAEEVARWRERDPLLLARATLRGRRRGRGELRTRSTRSSRVTLAERLARQVLARPVPDPAGAWADVWSDGSWRWRN